MGQRFRIDQPIAIVLVGLPLLAGVVLGANQTRAGAYLPWALSIVYWTGISVATWWLFALATQAVRLLLKPWVLPDWVIWTMGAVAGSFAARPTIYAIVEAFRPAMREPVLREMASARFDLDFVGYYLTNWSVIIAMWIVACLWLQRRAQMPTEPEARPISQDALCGLLLRLPLAVGRDVIALQAEDHYVRVFTRSGNALILISISEAIADVSASGIVGWRTHRSWWAARDAVVQQVNTGRQKFLVLCNDLRVPVSVTYRHAVGALPQVHGHADWQGARP